MFDTSRVFDRGVEAQVVDGIGLEDFDCRFMQILVVRVGSFGCVFNFELHDDL